ncbi:hypothetical protein H6G80_09845 [Nostoc sp. FACHB-87]|uniref:hypothetical protein n=1 Tax=Nostocales TaxID=1161 RepID=UPI00168839E2|nr:MULTISPECIES: hypothetical protein [Nostocales]MBD2298599.1 hypothetical protein [Nostoc sp. FACHB-190]MBD2454380.1 hypothetical protein [Nostoc sp. FACHB-87]MBD2474434.1 hypothetical protein [Anabaena sp. FACHB-83]MBD2487022.1 hypothetical protein [Aulosira sp. FACHB-615]
MGIKFKSFGGLVVLLATGLIFPAVASAEADTPNYETANEAFERAYFRHDRNFYENNTAKRQLHNFLGNGSGFRNTFPENEIARDAELMNTLYRDVMTQQAGNDPYLRTPDLPNPYDSSLLSSPRLNSDKLKVGTEFRF